MTRVLTILATAFLICAMGLSLPMLAEAWPEYPVKIVVPYVAGGGSDTVARVLVQELSEIFSQRFYIENKPGAGGMIGASDVAKAKPDGYTLLVGSPSEVALAPNWFKSMTYDPITDLVPISLVAWTPLLIVANQTFPASTPEQLVGLIKAREIDFSHSGVGSAHHLTGMYLNKLVSGHLLPIVYRGMAQALADTLSGQVALSISGLPPALPFLRSGHLKAIAVTSKRRSPFLPGVPALAETKGLEEFDTVSWYGLLAPKGMPAVLVEKLHLAVVQALKKDKVREILESQAAEPVGNTPDEFSRFIRAEATKYAKIIEVTGLKAE
jgi:tripartite-type tricarboxylate transporter receptor subunit TctC